MAKTLRFSKDGKSVEVSKDTLLRERSKAWAAKLIEAKTKVEEIEQIVTPLVDKLDISLEMVRLYGRTEIREKYTNSDELFAWLVEAINSSGVDQWRLRPVHYLALAHEFLFQDYRVHRK